MTDKERWDLFLWFIGGQDQIKDERVLPNPETSKAS